MDPTIAALVGAGFGAVVALANTFLSGGFADGRDARAAKRALTEKRLAELYSPLLAMRLEIFALSSQRAELFAKIDKCYRKEIELWSSRGLISDRDDYTEAMSSLLEYTNRQRSERLFPLYKQMHSLIREKMSFADPELTRRFAELTQYLGQWEMSDAGVQFPLQVHAETRMEEAVLDALYEHIGTVHARLQTELGIRSLVDADDNLHDLVRTDRVAREEAIDEMLRDIARKQLGEGSSPT